MAVEKLCVRWSCWRFAYFIEIWPKDLKNREGVGKLVHSGIHLWQRALAHKVFISTFKR